MIRRVVGTAVVYRQAVLVATGLFAVAAAVVSAGLKLDALPDITTNQVLVLTRARGLTPLEIERRVTRPIEAALGGMPGLAEQRSLSRYGISSVTAVFDDEVDPFRARQLVQERLNALGGALPAGVEAPELGPLSGGLGEIFQFTLASPVRTPAQLLELAVYQVGPLLRRVPGVVEVNTWGGQGRTLEVRADPARLVQRRVSLGRLREALARATGSVAGASLPAGPDHVLLRGVALPRDPGELGQAIVTVAGEGESGPPATGASLRVADLADVREGSLPRIGAATANGTGEIVYVMAQMLRGANALEVLAGLHATMETVRAVLPADVVIDVVYDRGVLVRATVATVGKNLLEGGLLVVVVLLVMLGSLRAGLVAAAVIPLAMVGATMGMTLFGIPGNLLSVGAIDFGLIVDGAVVMIEHVFHTLRPGSEGAAVSSRVEEAPLPIRIRAACEAVARPVFFSVLIILLVYVPVLSLAGVDGKMFRPMAVTAVLALLFALILTLTFVPAAAAALLRPGDIPAREPPLVRAMHRVYRPALAGAARHPALVGLAALVMLGGGVLLFARAGSEFVPQLDEGDLVVQTTRQPDISVEEAVRQAGIMEGALLRLPEVRQVVSRIGNPAVATDIMGLEQADVFVGLRPRAEWRAGLDRDALLAQMQARIEAASPGAEPSFTQPIQMRFNELLGGAVTDVTVAIFGPELGELRRLASAVSAAVSSVRGAADVKVLAPPEVSLLEVEPRPLAAAQRGFAAADVLDFVQALQSGIQVGVTYDGAVPIPIVLRSNVGATAQDLAGQGLVGTARGLVPLDQVARVERTTTAGLVSHLGAERRLLVGFNVRGADLGPVVAEARRRVAGAVTLERGYRLAWGGQYENLQSAARRMAVVLPVVVALILLVLLAAFRQVRPSLIVFTNVPFACVGGIAGLTLRGMPISISAAVGFIALSGVAVLNGVVLVSAIIDKQAEGASPAEAALAGAFGRARANVTTALVAALGFVPMMLARGVGAEVQRPLATVVVAGLFTSSLQSLFLLPTLYPWLARARGPAP